MLKIQELIDINLNYVSELGLSFHIDDELKNWKKHMESLPGDENTARSLDPDFNDVHPGNSFWISLKDSDDRIVACQGNRCLETENFVQEFIITRRFFGDRRPVLHYFPLELCDSVPVLNGRIGFGAGNWVHPDYRGKKISGVMSRMGRMLSLRHFLFDYYIGFVVATERRRQYGIQGLGLTNRRHLLHGRYPGKEGDFSVDIYWMHRSEMMSQIDQELDELDLSPVALNMRTA